MYIYIHMCIYIRHINILKKSQTGKQTQSTELEKQFDSGSALHLEGKIYKSSKNYFIKIMGSSRTAQW